MSREIKGPEGLKARMAVNLPAFELCFTAQEVGQIISLAMDAERDWWTAGFVGYDEKEKCAKAWRELAERLRSYT